MILSGLPLGILYSSEIKAEDELLMRLSGYEAEAQMSKTIRSYVLTKDVFAGDEITEDMIKTVDFRTLDSGTLINNEDKDVILGSYAKVRMDAGTVLGADTLSKEPIDPDDYRSFEVFLSCLPESLTVNDFVDIRVSFPDGEDFIVIPHKRVYALTGGEAEATGIVLKLSEEEILRYRSACVDEKAYDDTVIYALPYAGDYQYKATDYYPVNDEVFSLLQWDPNIEDLYVLESENTRRENLEDANFNYKN
ncbi:MAG: SAF domain-containing protein [Lachnospiraceae bacterium]|nr:SAF domain-containing protein [Lachnospiraceae bacterium]